MREKLNENPLAQIAVIGVLVLAVGFFLLHGGLGGGGESEGGEETSATSTEEAGTETAEGPATEGVETGVIGSEPTAATTSAQLPVTGKLPAKVESAYRRGDTIVVLVYRPGGIDDKLTREASEVTGAMSGVALFETKVAHVSRYAAITGPVGVEAAPALIVVRSKRLNQGGTAPATVDYGFQTAEDIRQAIVDSRYQGPELSYAPN